MTDRLIPHLSDELLNEYLDAALAPSARSTAAAHLAACPACAERLSSLSVVFSELAKLPPAPLRRDLRAGVMAAVRAQRPTALRPLADPKRRPVQLVFGLQLLAAFALLAFAWPFLVPLAGLQRIFAPGLFDGLAAGLTGARLPSANLWPAVQGWLAGLGTQSALLFAIVPSPLVVGLVLLAAGLLWLLGNALLLRPNAAPRLRRLL